MKKCRKILSDNPQLLPTFVQHRFEEEVQSNFLSSKRFYFKLKHLNARWGFKPRVTVVDCLQAKVAGKEMKISEDWLERHNYTGENVFYFEMTSDFRSVSL